MDEKRWLRLKELHERVFQLPLPEARAFVRREFSDDPELAEELISLLEQQTEGASFLRFDEAPGVASTFPPHHRLGDYELLVEIGRGGMGCVYLARHLPLDRDVALKILSPTLAARPEQVDRFRREAQRLARFKHPGIVPIYDVQSIGDVHFFAMEHVDGLDLHRELVCQRGQLDPEACRATLPPAGAPQYFPEVAEIVRQAAAALADAHGHRITHRDIKPHNLILGRDGRLRIVDFGIARDESLGQARPNDGASGTLYYMSPEQAQVARRRTVDHRTDIYSLGVVLYELLTLRRPFDGDTQREILKAIEVREAKDVRAVNPRVPKDLAVICHKAMEKDPAARYPDARAFADDLHRFLSGEPIHARPPDVPERVRRFARRRRLELGAAAVGAVALCAGFLMRGEVRADPNFAEILVDYRARPTDPRLLRLSWISYDPVMERFDPPVELGAPPYFSRKLEIGQVLLRAVWADGVVTDHWRYPGPSVDVQTVELSRGPLAAQGTEGMVLIPGGLLRRRSDVSRSLCSNLGQEIAVEAFYLDAREVTVGQIREFLRVSELAPPEHWSQIAADPALDERPAIGIPYQLMHAYAEYHGKRLATHAELEWAARGAEDRVTPNGKPLGPELQAAIHGTAPAMGSPIARHIELWRTETRDVGTSLDDLTPEGVHDLLGNVRETTASVFVNVLPLGQPPTEMRDAYWVLGGAWWSEEPPAGFDIHAFAGRAEPGDPDHGFRCARSVIR